MSKEVVLLEIRRQATEAADWTRRAYDEMYEETGIRQLDSFYLWILGLLRPVPGRRLLDASCGEGVLVRMARQMGMRAHGFDLSKTAVRIARDDEGNREVVVANGERLPYLDRSFDYVTNIGSLEHYLDMVSGVQEMARVLAPDGVACILLPNTYSLLGNVWSAFRKGMTLDDGQPLQRYGARREWEALLEDNGFVVERVVKYEREWPRSWVDVRWYLGHPRPLVHLLLSPLIPLNLASCFVYLCSRE